MIRRSLPSGGGVSSKDVMADVTDGEWNVFEPLVLERRAPLSIGDEAAGRPFVLDHALPEAR